MKKNLILISIFALALPILAFADFSEKDWQWKKEINLPKIESLEYIKLQLDKESSKMGVDYRDIRVISGEGEEIPYQLTVLKASSVSDFYSSVMMDKGKNPETGEVSFILDLGKAGVLHNEIKIGTYSENFKKRVSVYSGDNLMDTSDSRWKILASDGYIFNFTDKNANFSASGLSVRYPESSRRYIKVVIAGGGEGEVNISGANVLRYELSKASENISRVSLIKEENADLKAVILKADLGVRGFPTSKISFSSKENNFNRRISLQSGDDGKNWRNIAQGYVFSLDTPKFKGSSMTVEYPEQYSRYIRAIVWNDDNKSIQFENYAEISGISRMVAFEADPKLSYLLYYGNEKASSPKYDLARFFQYLEVAGMPEALLGAEQANADFVVPPETKPPFTERYPYLLNVLLVIIVVIVAIFLYFYISKNFKATAQKNSLEEGRDEIGKSGDVR